MDLPRRVTAATTSPTNRAQPKRKPIIEKRRRSRINTSMAQLEKLLPVTGGGAGRKAMEKADILEKTVQHVQRLQQQLQLLQQAATTAVQRRVLGDLGNAMAPPPSQANPWRPWSK